jgi:AmmeMemoRadiSam system protein A
MMTIAEPNSVPGLPPSERQLLLALAREAVRRAVSGEPLPGVAGCQVPPRLTRPSGCFVTLTRAGELRGCVGNLEPRWPLWQAVVENAAAATRDGRFSPVTRDELDTLELEISVLTVPAPLPFASPEDLLARLTPGRDGVVLEFGPRRATFLPQVWEKLPDRRRFLEELSLKAGAAADAWRRPGAGVSTYRVEHFSESEMAETGGGPAP